jgi:hypothetical protein
VRVHPFRSHPTFLTSLQPPPCHLPRFSHPASATPHAHIRARIVTHNIRACIVTYPRSCPIVTYPRSCAIVMYAHVRAPSSCTPTFVPHRHVLPHERAPHLMVLNVKYVANYVLRPQQAGSRARA